MTTRKLCTWIAALGVISSSLWAQNAPSGPVHFPSGYSTNAPDATLPAPTLDTSSPPANPPSTTLTMPLPNSALPAVPAATPPTTYAGSTSVAPGVQPGSSTGTASPSLAGALPQPAQVADDDSGDIRDIRGVISIPYPLLWILYILGGAVLAAGLWFLWKWLRRTVIKPKLPYEIALERLEKARALMVENQAREYAFAVSEVIRTYIEQRFGERAKRRTTEEFLSDLLKQRGTPLAVHRALLEDFLNHCDLPKFARWQLSVHEMESMHESARAFIFNTRPDAPVQAPAPPQLVPAK